MTKARRGYLYLSSETCQLDIQRRANVVIEERDVTVVEVDLGAGVVQQRVGPLRGQRRKRGRSKLRAKTLTKNGERVRKDCAHDLVDDEDEKSP